MAEITAAEFVALQPHAFANLLPWIKDTQKAAELAADIRKNGLVSAIVLFQGQILDGRNRHRACLQLIAEDAFEFSAAHHIKTFNGTEAEALDFVESLNIHRRHLTSTQRALAASSMVALRNGGQTSAGTSEKNLAAVEDVAEQCGVTPFMVVLANRIRDRVPAHIVEMCEQGTVTISAAERLLDTHSMARMMRLKTPEQVKKATSIAGNKRLKPWSSDRLIRTIEEMLTELGKRKPDDIDAKQLAQMKARVREFNPAREREHETAS